MARSAAACSAFSLKRCMMLSAPTLYDSTASWLVMFSELCSVVWALSAFLKLVSTSWAACEGLTRGALQF